MKEIQEKCNDCKYKFNCWTSKRKPRQLNGVAWKIATKKGIGDCLQCNHSHIEWYHNVGICNKHIILVHRNTTCSGFRSSHFHRRPRKSHYSVVKSELRESTRLRIRNGVPNRCFGPVYNKYQR